MHVLTVKPLRYIDTLWLGVYVRYTQQNPLKNGFSGIEVIVISHYEQDIIVITRVRGKGEDEC